jgi:hypothetical protein
MKVRLSMQVNLLVARGSIPVGGTYAGGNDAWMVVDPTGAGGSVPAGQVASVSLSTGKTYLAAATDQVEKATFVADPA